MIPDVHVVLYWMFNKSITGKEARYPGSLSRTRSVQNLNGTVTTVHLIITRAVIDQKICEKHENISLHILRLD